MKTNFVKAGLFLLMSCTFYFGWMLGNMAMHILWTRYTASDQDNDMNNRTMFIDIVEAQEGDDSMGDDDDSYTGDDSYADDDDSYADDDVSRRILFIY